MNPAWTSTPETVSALVVVDVLNTYDHEDADRLCAGMEPVVETIAGLLRRARDEDVPIIYVTTTTATGSRRRSSSSTPRCTRAATPSSSSRSCRRTTRTSSSRRATRSSTRHPWSICCASSAPRASCSADRSPSSASSTRAGCLRAPSRCRGAADAVAHIHEDLADAALQMMKRNMRADTRPADECEL